MDYLTNDPSNATIVHVSRSVRPEKVSLKITVIERFIHNNIVHLEDARWELDAVLNGGIEGVDHSWSSVSLPVCFVHLHNFKICKVHFGSDRSSRNDNVSSLVVSIYVFKLLEVNKHFSIKSHKVGA